MIDIAVAVAVAVGSVKSAIEIAKLLNASFSMQPIRSRPRSGAVLIRSSLK